MTNGEYIKRLVSSATIRECTNKDFNYIVVEQNNKWLMIIEIYKIRNLYFNNIEGIDKK